MMASGSNTEVSVSLSHRKQCLLLNNFVAIFGAVLMLLSQKAMSFEMIMLGRLLYGINSGKSAVWGSFHFISFFSITLGSQFNTTDNQFLFILVTIIFLSSLGHLSPSYWLLLTLLRIYDSLMYASRSHSVSSHDVPRWMRPQEAARDGGCDHRYLRLLGEVLWSAAGDQVRCPASKILWRVK